MEKSYPRHPYSSKVCLKYIRSPCTLFSHVFKSLFVDGLYILLRPHKRRKHQTEQEAAATAPCVPEHLQHLIINDISEGTCKWSLSGSQFPLPAPIQQRYCYPKGPEEYCNQKGGALWTMYAADGKEDLNYRILHVYFSPKRALNKPATSLIRPIANIINKVGRSAQTLSNHEKFHNVSYDRVRFYRGDCRRYSRLPEKLIDKADIADYVDDDLDDNSRPRKMYCISKSCNIQSNEDSSKYYSPVLDKYDQSYEQFSKFQSPRVQVVSPDDNRIQEKQNYNVNYDLSTRHGKNFRTMKKTLPFRPRQFNKLVNTYNSSHSLESDETCLLVSMEQLLSHPVETFSFSLSSSSLDDDFGLPSTRNSTTESFDQSNKKAPSSELVKGSCRPEAFNETLDLVRNSILLEIRKTDVTERSVFHGALRSWAQALATDPLNKFYLNDCGESYGNQQVPSDVPSDEPSTCSKNYEKSELDDTPIDENTRLGLDSIQLHDFVGCM